MIVQYDRETDTLTIAFREAPIQESDEVRPGLILDLGFDNEVVGLEVLDASKHIDLPDEALTFITT